LYLGRRKERKKVMAGKGKIKILRREEKIKRRVNILIYGYQYTLRSCSFPDRFPLVTKIKSHLPAKSG